MSNGHADILACSPRPRGSLGSLLSLGIQAQLHSRHSKVSWLSALEGPPLAGRLPQIPGGPLGGQAALGGTTPCNSRAAARKKQGNRGWVGVGSGGRRDLQRGTGDPTRF